MMYSDVIVGITISRGSFVFSQSRVKVSTSLTNIVSPYDHHITLQYKINVNALCSVNKELNWIEQGPALLEV